MTDEHEDRSGGEGEGARKSGRLGKVMIALAIGSVGCCAAGLSTPRASALSPSATAGWYRSRQ